MAFYRKRPFSRYKNIYGPDELFDRWGPLARSPHQRFRFGVYRRRRNHWAGDGVPYAAGFFDDRLYNPHSHLAVMRYGKSKDRGH